MKRVMDFLEMGRTLPLICKLNIGDEKFVRVVRILKNPFRIQGIIKFDMSSLKLLKRHDFIIKKPVISTCG